MRAFDLIAVKIWELKEDLNDAAKAVSSDSDDEKLLADLAHWAAGRCGENAEDVLQQVKVWANDKSVLPALRDILEVGAECNNPPPSWKFTDFLGFSSAEERDEWYNNRVLVTMHRGTKQIGGSITQITMGNTSVLTDFGSALPGSHGTIDDNDIVEKIFRKNKFKVDAVFFTHYHGDHAGLIDKIPKDIPIYMDPAMLKILQVLSKYTGNFSMQELLANRDGRIQTFTPGKLFSVGDMNIIPFFVDHSAYHANMFLFEGAGHTVLHSGDFRNTGYMSKSLEIIPKLIHERYNKQVDVLLTEGTMMTRSPKVENLLTEWDVNKEAANFMREHKQIFVVCSSTNFDSLTSICRAARTNNLPIYAGDYIMEMLKMFSDTAKEKNGLYDLPPVKSIREYFESKAGEYIILSGSLLGREKGKAEELYHNYGKGKKDYRPYLIYSMWQGYLDSGHPAYDEGLAAFVRQFDGRVKYIHSSGHADKETLAKFITNIAPRKYIVPFHTENPEGFKNLDIADKYKDMVILPQDGDTIKIA